MLRFRPLILLGLLFHILCATSAAAQEGADIIRGRVTGPDGEPLSAVIVTATSVSGNVSRRARTARDGRFTIVFPGGDGDYFVLFQSIGYGPRRFQVKRTADQDILVADARLAFAAQNLDTLQIAGERNRVNRNLNPQDLSGSERGVNTSALSAEQQGNLAAMAASLPGVQFIAGADGDPSGFSVFGLGADQNSTTLNGLNTDATNLPRDAAISSSLATSPYDVSRGGFSGGQFNLRSRSGSNYLTRSASVNLDHPALQWTDPAGRSLAQEFSNISFSSGVSGPITFDKSFYNISMQAGRRANDLPTLLNTSDVGLQAAGISPDSIARLRTILQAAGVPVTLGRIPDQRTNDSFLLFGALDWAPPGSLTGQALNITFNGNFSQQSPTTNLTSQMPAFSGERTNASGGTQIRHTNFYGIFLSETSLGVSLSRNESEPYLNLPSGSVLINSDFPDGGKGVSTIAFGGNPFLNTFQTTNIASFLNQLSWFSLNNKHRLKSTLELRRDAYELDQTVNALGTFRFNSLSDLENDTPLVFTRSLLPRTRAASQWIGGASLGDSWRVSPDLQVQYGLRVDGNVFNDTPGYNALVESTFGKRNDVVPNTFLASPRVGFSYSYGVAPQIAGFDGAVRGPRAVVRGGIGVFQNQPRTQLTGSALDNTGLAGGIQNLTCVGASAPVPDWAGYGLDLSTIPGACAGPGNPFSNATPNVTLFTKDFRPARSVRTNVQWSGVVLDNRFSATVDASYSLNQFQQGGFDINFDPTQQFTLATEASRPMFVAPNEIVPLTGAIAPTAARLSTSFARVTEQRSDLTGSSSQLNMRITPTRFSTNLTWNASYVLAKVRDQVTGFQNTGGDPRTIEWARSTFDARHQIAYNIGYNFFDVVRVNWSGSFRSGTPYTPVTQGDVNGDGYSNDRAFVVNPTAAADPAIGAAMQALINSTSGDARACLKRQLGQIAGRNSCEGPWTQSAVLTIAVNPLKVGLPQRASLSFNVSNPLGAADLLLHGQDKIKGWGQVPTPDPTLLYVRGFDPGTNRFRYDVNPRFGNVSPQLSTIRAPVTVTVQLRFDLAPTREEQLLIQGLDRGRRTDGNKAPEAQLRGQYSQAGLPNPMATILRSADTLELTVDQADSLALMNRWYLINLDSIWTPLLKELAALPDTYDRDAVYAKYIAARQRSVDLLLALSPRLNRLLTRTQRRKLPQFVAVYLDKRFLNSIRNGTAGSGFGLPGGFDIGAIRAGGGGGFPR